MTRLMKKRPTAVSVIGWFCIVAGCYGTFCGVWMIWKGLFGPVSTVTSETDFFVVGCDDRINTKLDFVAVSIGSICSVIEAIAGVYLLKVRAWARTAIESVAWFRILFESVGPIVFTVYLIGFEHKLADLPIRLTMISCAFLAIQCATLGAVNGVIIYFLRSKKVRDAVASPSQVRA